MDELDTEDPLNNAYFMNPASQALYEVLAVDRKRKRVNVRVYREGCKPHTNESLTIYRWISQRDLGVVALLRKDFMEIYYYINPTPKETE